MELARTTLAVLTLAALIVGSLRVLQPFLPSLLWATMLVVATWPLLRSVERRLGGRRPVAVTVMTLAVLLIFVAPLAVAIAALAQNADTLIGWSKSLQGISVPAPPEWLDRIPLAGESLDRRWSAAAALSPAELSARLAPHVGGAARWLLAQFGGLGLVFVHCLLTVVLAAILYARGEAAAAGLSALAVRLAGDRGGRIVLLSGQAVRGVALGVIGTALIQSALAGLGLLASGVPYPGILTAIAFLLCVAQLGPLLVLLPACGWLYYSGATGWATALLVWSMVVGLLDNVLRPLLIRRGADLPLLLIVAGVIGGLIAFGVIGLFIGPVLLAVTWTLLVDWVYTGVPPAAGAGPGITD